MDLTANLTLSYQFSTQLFNWDTWSGATYRDTVGNENACQYNVSHFMHSGTNPHIVGVGSWWWDGSKVCGQCLRIMNVHNGKEVTGVVGDYCPECSPRQLDLSQSLSMRLNDGKKPSNCDTLLVAKVDCDWYPKPQPVQYFLYPGSDNWQLYVAFMLDAQPAQAVTVNGSRGVHDLYGRWYVPLKMSPTTQAIQLLATVDTSRTRYFVPMTVPPPPASQTSTAATTPPPVTTSTSSVTISTSTSVALSTSSSSSATVPSASTSVLTTSSANSTTTTPLSTSTSASTASTTPSSVLTTTSSITSSLPVNVTSVVSSATSVLTTIVTSTVLPILKPTGLVAQARQYVARVLAPELHDEL